MNSLTSQPSIAAVDFDDETIARTIEALLARRAVDATICPSDVARALWTDEATWRAAMPAIRRVAAALARAGALVATRRGRPVDAESPGGPVRLGRPR